MCLFVFRAPLLHCTHLHIGICQSLGKVEHIQKTCVTLGQIALNVFGVFCKHLLEHFFIIFFLKCKRLFFFSLKKRHLQLLLSLCVLFIIPSAWAVVGHGSNVNRRSSYNASPKKVIVSRSHSGKVKNYIRNAFGNSTTIIEAGGAGEWSFTFI